MSAVEIHGMALSAPCRICYLACEAIGIEYKMVDCDLMNGGNKTPEYLKVINIYLLVWQIIFAYFYQLSYSVELGNKEHFGRPRIFPQCQKFLILMK